MRSLLKLALALFFIFQSMSCVHKEELQNNFDHKISENKCEEALKVIPHENKIFKLVSTSETAAGTVVSYSAQTLGFTIDVAFDFAKAGLIILTVGAIESVVTPSGTQLISSVEKPTYHEDSEFLDFSKTPFTDAFYTQTQPLRCPNIDEIAENIRKVAKCYTNEGKAGFKKAEHMLLFAFDDKTFELCLSPAEQQIYHQEIDQYDKLGN